MYGMQDSDCEQCAASVVNGSRRPIGQAQVLLPASAIKEQQAPARCTNQSWNAVPAFCTTHSLSFGVTPISRHPQPNGCCSCLQMPACLPSTHCWRRTLQGRIAAVPYAEPAQATPLLQRHQSYLQPSCDLPMTGPHSNPSLHSRCQLTLQQHSKCSLPMAQHSGQLAQCRLNTRILQWPQRSLYYQSMLLAPAQTASAPCLKHRPCTTRCSSLSRMQACLAASWPIAVL